MVELMKAPGQRSNLPSYGPGEALLSTGIGIRTQGVEDARKTETMPEQYPRAMGP